MKSAEEFEDYTGIPGDLPGEKAVGCWWCITPSYLLYPEQESKAFKPNQVANVHEDIISISHCMGMPFFDVQMGKNYYDILWNVAIYCTDPAFDRNKEFVYKAHRWLVEELQSYAMMLVLNSADPDSLKGQTLFYLIADFNNGTDAHVWPIAF